MSIKVRHAIWRAVMRGGRSKLEVILKSFSSPCHHQFSILLQIKMHPVRLLLISRRCVQTCLCYASKRHILHENQEAVNHERDSWSVWGGVKVFVGKWEG